MVLDLHKRSVGRVQIAQVKLASLENELAMLVVQSFLVELDVAARTFADPNRRIVVEVDDILLDFSRVVFVAHNHERRMHQTLTVKDVFLAFISGYLLDLLFADLTAQVVLEVLIAVRCPCLGARTDPAFEAKVMAEFN